jgi:hypothetical protein
VATEIHAAYSERHDYESEHGAEPRIGKVHGDRQDHEERNENESQPQYKQSNAHGYRSSGGSHVRGGRLCLLTSAFCRAACAAQRAGGVGQQRAVRLHSLRHEIAHQSSGAHPHLRADRS